MQQMQQTQAPDNRQPGICTFSAYRAVDTSNGSKFYRFTGGYTRDVCRVDERFIPLIEDLMERLYQGQEVDFVCIPDLENKPNGWRLDLDYYRSRQDNQAPVVPVFPPKESTEFIGSDQKSVTFSISKQDHTLITNLHKKLKHINPVFTKFSDLTSYIFETSVRTLRIQHPELDENQSDLPF